MTGYSGTPLARKLGINEGLVVRTSGAPHDFSELLDPTPEHVDIGSGGGPADIFILF